MTIIGAPIAQSQEDTNEFLELVNSAIEDAKYLHVKSTSISKYFTKTDTTVRTAETWIFKTPKDTVLGMYIRSKCQFSWGEMETFHKGTETWAIGHKHKKITRYDQSKGHPDGFKGGIMTLWTLASPLVTGIRPRDIDSVFIQSLENGDWRIEVFSPDDPTYGMHSKRNIYWIDHSNYLPYRFLNLWKIGDGQTRNELLLEIVDNTKEGVSKGLYQSYPDYTITDYVKKDRSQRKPLTKGTPVPEMKGYYLTDSSDFDLSDHLDSKLIIVDFWYQSCGPCIQALPYIDTLKQEFADKGLVVFEVNSRDHEVERDKLMKFVKNRGSRPESVVMIDLDTEHKIWKTYSNPRYYFIQDRKIVGVVKVFSPEVMPAFRSQIEMLLSKE